MEATAQLVAWDTVVVVDGMQDMQEASFSHTTVEQEELIRPRAMEVRAVSVQRVYLSSWVIMLYVESIYLHL